MNPNANKREDRILELDGVRGLAALAVVAFHFLTNYAKVWGHAPGFWPRFPYGYLGVDLFFMVSGFVILMTISRVKNSVEFAVNRFARLYPVYWVAVSLTFLCVSLFPIRQAEAGIPDYLVNLTMLNNAVNPFLPDTLRIRSVDGAYWSLQPELFFYGLILLPFVLCRLRRLELWIFGWLLISLVVALLPHNRMTNGVSFLLNLRHADLFAAGMIFFLARSRGISLAQVALLGLCLVNRFVIGGWTIGVVAVGFYCVFSLLHMNMAACLRSRTLVFLGAISYSLYLVHQNLGYIMIHGAYELGISPWLSVPVAVAVVLLVATGLTYLVEKPANRALRKLYGARCARKSSLSGAPATRSGGGHLDTVLKAEGVTVSRPAATQPVEAMSSHEIESRVPIQSPLQASAQPDRDPT